MAKRRKRGSTAAMDGGKLGDFAEVLGSALGTAENKARGWLDQRKQLARQLAQVRDKADQLLRELTGGAAHMAVAVTRSRRRAVGAKSRKKRTLSIAARKAISDAQKARWARQKGSMKTARTAKKRPSA